MKYFYIFISVLILLTSCAKKEFNEEINMPSTPVLTVTSRWGVVSSPYITVTDINDRHNKIITTLRKGDIVEVLSKESEKGGDSSYWYEIRIDDVSGVVIESVIELYNSKLKALNASESM